MPTTGVVHRDLKPANILLKDAPQWESKYATSPPTSLPPYGTRPRSTGGGAVRRVPLALPAGGRVSLPGSDQIQGPPQGQAHRVGRIAVCSGADVVNLCGKACAIPFIEVVERGIDRDVTMADFQQVMAEVKPSVRRKEVGKYEKFRFGE